VCVLRLTADKLCFILTDQTAGGGPAVWSELRQENYFNDYNIEGISQEQNEILLELQTEKMSKTLSAMKSTSSAVNR
jgi:HUS1 checkpoint protein